MNDTKKSKNGESSLFIKIIIICVLLIIIRDTSYKEFFAYNDPSSITLSDDANDALIGLHDKEVLGKAFGLDIYGKAFDNRLDFSDLGKTAKERNHKSIGWINIPGVIINYPIMYALDNAYYLKHTSKGVSSMYGAIFMEAASEGHWNKINLIHGHNMNDGAMFGDLDKYRSLNWLNKHKTIYVTEDDGYKYAYEVFSVYTMNGNSEKITISCKSDKEYSEYFAKLAKRSMFKLKTPNANSRIVMLNTCSYAYNGEHLIVCAYRKE